MALKLEILDYFYKLLRKESGLVLDASKQYLIETRLEPIVMHEGFTSIEALGRKLMHNDDTLLRQKVVDAMTTNETSFFRDQKPFDILKSEILPEILKAKEDEKRIRIWCAASSTGQEPYSIGILLNEMARALRGWDIEIIATDISEPVLKKARIGMYSLYEVQRGLPPHYLDKYFEKSNGMWCIHDAVRKLVSFRKINLLSDFGALGTMDIIFCRNILIYFDKETKERVLDRMRNLLSPSGYVLLGASETLLGMESKFVGVGSTGRHFYKKINN